MKQRNAMIAVWAALLLSVGTALALAVQDAGAPLEDDPFFVPESELKPGESRRVAVSPDAVEVRLFVEGLPFRETPHVQALMDQTAGLPLTGADREILDRSLIRYRLLPSEQHATPACYDPHHIFRYFNAKGEQVGKLEVCYCCRQVRVYSDDPRRARGEVFDFDFEGAATMLKAMNVPTDINCSERA